MKDRPTHINDYVRKLLNDPEYFKSEYNLYYANDYSFENIYGCISPDLLSQFILKSKRNSKAQCMLVDLLLYVNADSITDYNFKLLLHANRKYKSTYLSQLGHASLSFYQMQELNRHPLSNEAFAWLLDKCLSNDLFSNEDVLKILSDNKYVTKTCIQECINYALKQYGPSSKIDIAIAWLARRGA